MSAPETVPGYRGHLLTRSFVQARASGLTQLASAAPLQRALRAWWTGASQLGPASAVRALVEVAVHPLVALLGMRVGSNTTLVGDAACLRGHAGNTRVIWLVTPWGASMDGYWRRAVGEAHQADAAWCLIFNGRQLRLLHASGLHPGRHAQIDVEVAADELLAASTLALIFSADALGIGTDGRSPLETLIAESDRHGTAVCRSLRDGVLEASTEVLRALATRERRMPPPAIFEQALTIVYRLLFLLFAEARGLVPSWHPVYRESYSLDGLCDAALEKETVGLWDALRAVARLAHAGCRAGDLTVTAFNGRLFSPSRTPLAERHDLDDAAAGRALVVLSTRRSDDGRGRERISYADLGVEQLGAVYEALLDYEPHVERGPSRRVRQVELRPGSGVRKATGTFYTPQPLVSYLVRDTLAPLTRNASPDAILALRVLDPSMGSGAFLVGACRFLAAAYERACVEAGRFHATDIGPAERAAMRRLVAERCLFGVDVNPTAVQLARLSIWLTTLAAERPLTFLDHHLRSGDSLAGAWLSHLRTPPRRKATAGALPLFDEAAADALQGILPVRFRLASGPNDTAAQVREKERALAALVAPESPLARWSTIADLWCGAWLASPPLPPAAFADLSEVVLGGRSALPGSTARSLLASTRTEGRGRRLFHWELEFPEVFFDERGARRPDAGFDAVLGNPPWDMIRADGKADRAAQRTGTAALVRFARESGTYGVKPDGQVNRYQLFVERAVALSRPGGRIGLVLPSGVLSDSGSAGLRRFVFSRCAVDRLVGFDNRRGTFPIHRGVRFVLLSAVAGQTTRETWCRFGETGTTQLEGAATDEGPVPGWFPIRLTPELLERISGADRSVPDLRSPRDLAILERAHARFPRLGDACGWHARFGRELNVTEDRSLLGTGRGTVPVLEGKSIEPFRARPEIARWRIDPSDADRRLGSRWHAGRLAYRDVASAGNRQTLIAAILPARSVSTHTLFCLRNAWPVASQHLLCALFNSLVVNFLVRMRVSVHVTTALVEQLPIPTEDDLGPWARELSTHAVALQQSPNSARLARVNAIVAHVYQLSAGELTHVLSTFPLVPADERQATVEAYRRL
ncbi:MAG: N-6 DNA methylase [Vicinamibacterales bacterium]